MIRLRKAKYKGFNQPKHPQSQWEQTRVLIIPNMKRKKATLLDPLPILQLFFFFLMLSFSQSQLAPETLFQCLEMGSHTGIKNFIFFNLVKCRHLTPIRIFFNFLSINACLKYNHQYLYFFKRVKKARHAFLPRLVTSTASNKSLKRNVQWRLTERCKRLGHLCVSKSHFKLLPKAVEP